MRNPGKFARSWSLFTSTLQVTWQHKKLLLFPLVSFICSVVIVLFFLSPALLYPSGHGLGDLAHWRSLAARFGLDLEQRDHPFHPTTWFYAYASVLYLVSMFVATFANVALYHEIMKALAGGAVSVRAGLQFAGSRLPAILMWSLFAGLVGLIISTLEDRFGWIGRTVMKFVGVVWSVASVFAIPVLIREHSANPLVLLRHSATTLQKTWGESLIGYAGITVVSWLAGVISFLLFVLAFALAVTVHYGFLIVLVILAWLGAMILLGYLTSIISHVYRCALYVYATEGIVPAPYSAEMMDAGWKIKRR